MKKTGSISVNSENIFPIIKKWLYSDKDIFLRELVSNGCDAISKLLKLVSMGEAKKSDEDPAITVTVSKKNKTITVSDNGIGMTADEVVKYITEVAFSGAEEFLNKYKDENEDNKIIGHFGLGFYSAFMVSKSVEIETLSYKEGEKPVKWLCDGGTEYELSEGSRQTVGTTITLNVAEDSEEFLEESELSKILNKYCSFLAYPITLISDENEEKDIKPINDTDPLWIKNPKDCTKEEYISFYQKVFFDFSEPLFWIHLNVEYPFRLQGILYFPRLKNEMANIEGQIKLFNNRVYVADNVKEVVPEFMLLLKGVIDCPDLPLNVSRSFLQNDGYAKKVSAHITKKVADKLSDLYKNSREDYDAYWSDIHPFIKFGCIRDDKFYEKVKPFLLAKDLDDNIVSLSDMLNEKDKKIYYCSDPVIQAQYVNMFKEQNIPAIILDHVIDNPFINLLEMKNEGISFARIDSEISDTLTQDSSEDNSALVDLFKNHLNIDGLKIEAKALKTEKNPAIILLSEQSRRMIDLAKIYGQANMFGAMKEENTLILNTGNKLIKKISSIQNDDDKKLIISHVYDLATLAHKPLDPQQLSAFIERSEEIMEKAL